MNRTAGTRAAAGLAAALLWLALLHPAWGAEPAAAKRSPHYVGSGFFDIHVCNWPNQPLFLMALFSTTRFDDVAAVSVLDPQGNPIASLDLARYRLEKHPGAPEKRVFMRNIALPPKPAEGWYRAKISLRNGATEEARDYVVMRTLPIATGLKPAADAENVPLPKELSWDPVPGARYYQVYLKDMWDGERVILTSKIVGEPRLDLPQGLIKPGGLYAWRVHARHLNGDARYGDFNHGSLGPEQTFSVAP